MKNKQLHNWKKEELVAELERRNHQYGELANKYKELLDSSSTLCESDKIITWINEDIKYQKSKLVNDFEKDKPLKWRITGMEFLKNKIEKEVTKK